jgi:FkbM family methyltransferase
MIFVQLGAGAGDLDPRANYRDGFSEFVKKHDASKKQIFLVEANPANIEKLKKCWKDYKNVKIFNHAIVPDNVNNDALDFFYSEDDRPHYQTFSLKIEHIKKHYPTSQIKKIKIKTEKINNFLNLNFKNIIIDYLGIDLEGIDFEILNSINFNNFNIKNISFEYLHLTTTEKKKIINKLNSYGYSYCGYGLDHNNFDYLFTKKKLFLNQLISKIIPYISNKYVKFLNTFIKSN